MLKKLLVVLTSITLSMTTTALSAKTETKQYKGYEHSGLASWYGRQFHGRTAANGTKFNMNAMTAAHKTLPLNCTVRVTNKENGKSVVVKITDRGPFHGNRVLDLSYGASKVLGFTEKGVANVHIEVLDVPKKFVYKH